MKKSRTETRSSKSLNCASTALALLLSSCISGPAQDGSRATGDRLLCVNARRFAGREIGNGHCVTLIKRCTGAPDTIYWRPGARVLNTTLQPGTVIATFKNGRYPSRRGYHAAIYIKHDRNGIWVWDQWRGKPVHQRLIRIRNDSAFASNTAQEYRVVHVSSGFTSERPPIP